MNARTCFCLALLAAPALLAAVDVTAVAQTSTTQTITAKPDPGTLVRYRGYTKEVYYFLVKGSDQGTIWGTGIYTDDSPLAVAAVHAGKLEVGQRGIIGVRMLDGLAEYQGSTEHGIASRDYGSHLGSYRIVFVRKVPTRRGIQRPVS
jgi:hypothetical protein